MGLTLASATDVLAADGLLIRAPAWARAVVPLELYMGNGLMRHEDAA